MSNSASNSLPKTVFLTVLMILPFSSFSNFDGCESRMNVVPWRSMYPTSFSAISVSKPRSGMDRIATVVSYPRAVRNPAVSEMYDAPTHSVLPGASWRRCRPT